MKAVRCFKCNKPQNIWSLLKGSLPTTWRCIDEMEESKISSTLKNQLKPYSVESRRVLFLCEKCLQEELSLFEKVEEVLINIEETREKEKKFRKQVEERYLEWIASNPEANKLLNEGPRRQDLLLVYRWLKSRKGMRVRVKYETSEGPEFSKSAVFQIGDPHVENEKYNKYKNYLRLVWKIPDLDAEIEIPAPTYCEVKTAENQIIYKLGYAIFWQYGEESGMTTTGDKKQVAIWNTYTFQEESQLNKGD